MRSNNRLKEIREQKGLSQKELAVQIGISRKTISSYETGRAIPSLKVALKIAKALDTTIEDLF